MNVPRSFQRFSSSGFTLIELLVVMGMTVILALVVSVTLLRPQGTASLDSTVMTLVADLRQQQLRAMTGESDGSNPQPFGLRVETNQYVLFRGSSYSVGDSSNVTISLGEGITATTTLPSSQVIFSRMSGEVASFVNGNNTITLQHSSGVSKTITLNRLGVVSVN